MTKNKQLEISKVKAKMLVHGVKSLYNFNLGSTKHILKPTIVKCKG